MCLVLYGITTRIVVLLDDGGKEGKPFRVKRRSLSYCNWSAVPFAVLGNIVPDFPLCDKSFNLSYSGADM